MPGPKEECGLHPAVTPPMAENLVEIPIDELDWDGLLPEKSREMR